MKRDKKGKEERVGNREEGKEGNARQPQQTT
jgi:hypothetical protein